MKTWTGLLIGGLAAGLLAGCGKGGAADAKARPVPLVQTAKAVQQDLVRFGMVTGSVEPVKVARMASPAEGPVALCPVREGDVVKAGDLVAQVGRSRIATTALAAAQEELLRQQTEFKRVEQLVKSGALPGEQLDVARADIKRAEAQLAAMETGAGDYEIHAPWSGQVSRVWIAEGDYVVPRAVLVEMYDPESLVVRLAVPEQQALSVEQGMAVRVRLDAHPGKQFAAEISRVYPVLDRQTRTLTVEAELQEPAKLLAGMFARVEIPERSVEQAVVIPQSALSVLSDGSSVVWRLKDGAVERVAVDVLLEADGRMAVEGALEPNDVVVIRGNESLKPGAKVKVQGAAKTSSPEKAAP
ncbi:efflux RND transporter periplasmic adaptor subunit [Pontiellaceae bacterium B1224]|nr:efflux RND transporter periplasmic adaptor subunit [Pontiellaceae bacterium B1224]